MSQTYKCDRCGKAGDNVIVRTYQFDGAMELEGYGPVHLNFNILVRVGSYGEDSPDLCGGCFVYYAELMLHLIKGGAKETFEEPVTGVVAESA